jgi:hypothetical protein
VVLPGGTRQRFQLEGDAEAGAGCVSRARPLSLVSCLAHAYLGLGDSFSQEKVATGHYYSSLVDGGRGDGEVWPRAGGCLFVCGVCGAECAAVFGSSPWAHSCPLLVKFTKEGSDAHCLRGCLESPLVYGCVCVAMEPLLCRGGKWATCACEVCWGAVKRSVWCWRHCFLFPVVATCSLVATNSLLFLRVFLAYCTPATRRIRWYLWSLSVFLGEQVSRLLALLDQPFCAYIQLLVKHLLHVGVGVHPVPPHPCAL